MPHQPIPVSMVTCAGRFRDNRRGILSVQALGPSFAELVIDQPPQFGAPGTRTTIAMSGDKVAEVAGQLRALADALDHVTDMEAWRQYEPDATQRQSPWGWQHYAEAPEGEVTA